MPLSSKKMEQWNELVLGVVIGLVGNALIESFFGLIESFNIIIPPSVWLIQILSYSMFLAWLLWKNWGVIFFRWT